MYEIALSRVELIERLYNGYIRKWTGLPRIINTSALYRKRGALQLPLTSIVEIFKAGKVRTVMMLRESNDQAISDNPPDVRTARKWDAEKATDDITAVLKHKDIIGSTQTGRAGLGSSDFRPFSRMTKAERRLSATGQVRILEADKRDVHLVQCAQQGQVVGWEELVVERKISWKEIWEWSTSRLSFLVRATYDVLPSPVNLVRWKIQEEDKCMCGKVATMKHILSNCHLALDRYTWRHNKVLEKLVEVAEEQAEAGRYGMKAKQELRPIQFVPQGKTKTTKGTESESMAPEGNERWEVAADLAGRDRVLPINTSKRPDLVLWSTVTKEVHLVELTVPHEDNISEAHERKERRYDKLVEECEDAGWKTLQFSVEVGCRGFVAESTRRWLKVAGLGMKQQARLIRQVQEQVEKASHWIWLKRDDSTWNES